MDLSNDTLVYEICEPLSVNCSYYRGVITVKPNPDDAEMTDVLYKNIWMPAKQAEAGDLKEKMKTMIIRKFQWMKQTYEARYRGDESIDHAFKANGEAEASRVENREILIRS